MLYHPDDGDVQAAAGVCASVFTGALFCVCPAAAAEMMLAGGGAGSGSGGITAS
jgi:hypothetical protein